MAIELALSLALGAGVYLLFLGRTAPAAAPTAPPGRRGLQEFLVRAGLPDVTPREFALVALGAGALVGLVAQLLLGWGLVSLLAAAVAAAAPVAYYVRRHDRRRAAIEAALVDAIGQLRDGIKTGLSVQEALAGLGRTGPEALRPELARLVREARLVGFERALGDLRDRLADPLADLVAASLLLNDRLGGRHVTAVLDRLAHATREQLRLQEEIRAGQARNVLSARIVAAVPLVVLVAIRRVNPSYLAVFDGWAGQALLAGCVASVAVGYAAMLWLTRLPEERRVLR
jgi:tight adherence protein B